MLVKDFNTFKKYLPAIVMKGGLAPFEDALDAAQFRLVRDILGESLENLLETDPEGNARLLTLVQRAICVDAFLSNIPEMDLILTDAGFAVSQNEQVAPASTARVQAMTASLIAKSDNTKDDIVSYLMSNAKYDEWRGSEQFGKLSDGLIFTFGEFKDVAVKNSISKDSYPKNWSEFIMLNSALNTALMTSVASYISKAYAEELIERTRDKEALIPNEVKVLKVIKTSIAAHALGDEALGTKMAIRAAQMMKEHITDFPTYADSPESAEVKLKHSDTPIFSMF